MEIIQNTSYESICEYKWEANSTELPPNNSLVHCHLDNIVPFFNAIKKTNNRYILVSSSSDYSVAYQEPDTVSKDMARWLKFVDCKDLGYNAIVIPSRCDIEQCRITDKYLIKLYSWSKFSLDIVPPNVVRWFCTNVDVDDDSRIVQIPFGVPSWSIDLLKHRDKDKALYVNFMLNTVERADLMKYYKSYTHNDLICERDVSHERFIDCVARSKYTLAAHGNGLDSYRVLESLYCRTIPIIKKSNWSNTYKNLPVLQVDSLYLDIDEFGRSYDELNNQVDWSLENSDADLNTWKKRFTEAKNLL